MPGGDMGGRGSAMLEIPDSLESWLSTAQDVPDDIRTWLEGLLEQHNSQPTPPEGGEISADGQEPPQNNGQRPAESAPGQGGGVESGTPSTLFALAENTHIFFWNHRFHAVRQMGAHLCALPFLLHKTTLKASFSAQKRK